MIFTSKELELIRAAILYGLDDDDSRGNSTEEEIARANSIVNKINLTLKGEL